METKDAIESVASKLATNRLISEVASTILKTPGWLCLHYKFWKYYIAHVFSFDFEITSACWIMAVEWANHI